MEPKLPQGEANSSSSQERAGTTFPLEREYSLPERPSSAPIERLKEQQSQPSQMSTTPTAIAAPTLPLPSPAISAQDATQTATDDNPATAADEDLIEKEWVERAKQIINVTKEDPHRRELEVNRLQTDYLKKRYGKDLGQSV